MGLMTNPKTQKVFSRYVRRLYRPLSVLLYLGALVALVTVSSHQFSERTYMSENALLPGLVERQYKSTSDVADYARKLKELIDARGSIPHEWLKRSFEKIGLDTYSQNFSAAHPFLSESEIVDGTNVYAILRAPRVAGTEAVVFSIPFREEGSPSGDTGYGIALMMSLAKHFIQQSYWSKDIIFLVVDEENIGAQAWLEAYHAVDSEHIIRTPLHGRSGAIMAAINLELPGKRINNFDLRLEGLNGQLPNLDLFNMVVKLCDKEGIEPTFHGKGSLTHQDLRELYGIPTTSKTMLSNMLRQASGEPHGIHGLFLRYGIPALTIHGELSGSPRGDQTHSIGYILEGVFRSINNLLERFHQSFFFYVLPETKKYVSIGLYMIPMGMLLMIPTLQGLALWFTLGKGNGDSDDVSGSSKDKNNSIVVPPKEHRYVIPILIGVHVCGLVLYLSPEFFLVEVSAYFGLAPTDGILTGLAAILAGILFLQVLGRRPSTRSDESQDGVERRWILLKCYALVWQAISLLGLSMINFSLAFLVAIFTIPVFALCRPYKSMIASLLYKAVLLLVSPPFIVLILMAVHDVIFLGHTLSLDMFYDLVVKSLNCVPTAVIDQYLFNNWTFAVVCLVLFPSWKMFWFCSSVK